MVGGPCATCDVRITTATEGGDTTTSICHRFWDQPGPPLTPFSWMFGMFAGPTAALCVSCGNLSSLRLEVTFRVGDSVLLLQPPVVAGGPRHWRTLVTLHLSYCECQGGCGAATPWTGSQTHLCDRCTHASSAGPLHKFVADNRRIPLLACLFAVVPWATLNKNALTEKSYHKLALLLY